MTESMQQAMTATREHEMLGVHDLHIGEEDDLVMRTVCTRRES